MVKLPYHTISLGDEERFGREMNVVKDVSFEGRIVDMTQKAIAFVDTQIKEYTYLGEDALFVTIPQYPPFCWTELIVNAMAHRDYSILGTDIMVKIFDHHYVVESPGILPGMVRIDNIRQMHFSRNPKITEFMRELVSDGKASLDETVAKTFVFLFFYFIKDLRPLWM